MADEIIIHPSDDNQALAIAGQAANRAAGAGVFSDYQARKAVNTLKRQANDLALFADYLRAVAIPGRLPAGGELASDPASWRGITWGLVAGFMRWLLSEGYAVSSVNIRLSTIKVYASLAAQVGALEAQELALIQTVHGYRRAEGRHLDELRQAAGSPTRRSIRRGSLARAGKKARSTAITTEQAQALKARPDTPQGRRDRLLLCLMIDHGLRVGEVARLTVSDFDLREGALRFYRPKVDKVQTHRLTPDTLRAARAYLASDGPALGTIWRASASRRDGRAKAGTLTGQGLTARAITQRVTDLGQALKIANLSAHDLRHFWATQAARKGTDPFSLQEAGGWASLDMPRRYVEDAKISNAGIKL